MHLLYYIDTSHDDKSTLISFHSTNEEDVESVFLLAIICVCVGYI